MLFISLYFSIKENYNKLIWNCRELRYSIELYGVLPFSALIGFNIETNLFKWVWKLIRISIKYLRVFYQVTFYNTIYYILSCDFKKNPKLQNFKNFLHISWHFYRKKLVITDWNRRKQWNWIQNGQGKWK